MFQESQSRSKSIIGYSQGSHSDWKTCKNLENGKTFSSQGILNRLEKSGIYVDAKAKKILFSCCFRLDVVIGHDIGCVSAAYICARLEYLPAFVAISPLITIPTK